MLAKIIRTSFLGILIFICTISEGQINNTVAVGHAYTTGESLQYSISYGFITGGYVTFTVVDTLLQGKKANKISLFARSAGLLDALYKIRDQYISYVDVDRDQPLFSIRSIREGRYRYYNEVAYDYQNQINDSITIFSKKSGEVKVPLDIQDILSAFYYARNFDFNDQLKEGQILKYTTYFSDDIFPLRIKFIRNEVVKTKYGKVDCYLFYPVTEVGRAFKTEEDMQVWISRDENRIPVKVKVNLKVGSFTCELDDYKGLNNAFTSVQQ